MHKFPLQITKLYSSAFDIAKQKHSDLAKLSREARMGLVRKKSMFPFGRQLILNNSPDSEQQARKRKICNSETCFVHSVKWCGYQCISRWSSRRTSHPFLNALRPRAQFDLKPFLPAKRRKHKGYKGRVIVEDMSKPETFQAKVLGHSDLRETICILFKLPLLHRNTTYESTLGGLLSFKTTVTLLLTVDPSDKKMMD